MELVSEYGVGVEQRRNKLTSLFQTLPRYASAEFWQAMALPEMPLEVLVRCLRYASAYADVPGRDRLLEIIIQRIQTANEAWARRIARSTLNYGVDDVQAIAADIYADLCERMVRALLDAQRAFWEENFIHCLYYERKHVYAAWSAREGWRQVPPTERSIRIPRILVSSLDQLVERASGESWLVDIEDKQAQLLLSDCETGDLLWYVLHLPLACKAVVLLHFWEGYTLHEIAQLLGVTERTVRNRLRKACDLLRTVLLEHGKVMNPA